MNFLKIFLLLLFFFIISLSFIACGYKPSSYYAKQELSGNIYLNVDISLEDPKNTVLIQDLILKILIQKLSSNIVDDKNDANIIMNVKIKNINFVVLQYDSLGYNKLYNAEVYLQVDYFNKEKQYKKTFTISGENNFSVDTTGTGNDANRFDAIKKASEQAINQFLSQVSVLYFQ